MSLCRYSNNLTVYTPKAESITHNPVVHLFKILDYLLRKLVIHPMLHQPATGDAQTPLMYQNVLLHSVNLTKFSGQFPHSTPAQHTSLHYC